MALPAERAYLLATAALDAVVTAYTDDGADLPERRYVSDGLPAWDCEQLTVRILRIYAGTPDEELLGSRNCPLTLTAVVGVGLVRCVPVMGDSGTPPAAADIDASAQVVLEDPLRLYAALREAQKGGDLAGCSGLAFEQWTALGPEGGVAGGELTVRLLLTSG